MAQWLDSSFFSFDASVFNFMHNLALKAGGFFTPFFKVVSFFGEGGIFFIILGVLLLLFNNTRKNGVALLMAILIGFILTNIIIKNSVARLRPYQSCERYREFWAFVKSKDQSEYSFPSGHVTVTMASMTALFFTCKKKWSWVFFLFALLMCFARVYQIFHYATDVIGGLIVGGVAGTCAFFIVKAIYKAIEKNKEKAFCFFLLNADLYCWLKSKFKKDKTV